MQESVDQIKRVLDNEIKMLGNSRKLCIGGFSQGGVMALRVGLEYD
jgi:predicted esterase